METPLITGENEYLELSGIAVASCFGGNSGNVTVVHIYNPRAFRNRAGISEGYSNRIVADPGFAPESKDLLLILLAVYGYLIGGFSIRSTSHLWGQHFCPRSTASVNILGGGKHLLRPLQFYPSQIGIYLELVNVPVTEEITP